MNFLASFDEFMTGDGIWIVVGVLALALVVTVVFLILNIVKAKKQKALEEADAANKTALEEAIAAAIEALKQELTEADRELNDSIEAVKAKAQSNIIIVSVVFAVLILGLCACVAVLFKKAK